MKQNGIEKTVIIQVIHCRYGNSYLADVLRRAARIPDFGAELVELFDERPAAAEHLRRRV